jgi:hypothetical protein
MDLTSALAVDTHRVRIVLDDTPQAISALLAGDALNPSTWQIERLDTLAPFTVASVAGISSSAFDLYVLEALGSRSVAHRVSSTTVLGATETNMELDAELPIEFDPLPSPSSVSMDFWGLAESVTAIPTASGTQDVLNAPTPTQDRVGGTMRVVSGDYQLHSGADLYRKLVLRRLLTRPGAFFHLPNYGLGLVVKEPVPMGSMTRLKSEIERQIGLEPETISANASISVTPDGIATYDLTCKIKGQTGSVSIPVPNEVSL